MSSSLHPAIAGQILGISTKTEIELKPANDQPSREQMLEKLKADAVALLHRLEATSADIKLTDR